MKTNASLSSLFEIPLKIITVHLCPAENHAVLHLVLLDGLQAVLRLQQLHRLGQRLFRLAAEAVVVVHAVRLHRPLQPLPRGVRGRVDVDHHVVHRLWHRVLPLEVDPRRKVHEALRQALHVEVVQGRRADDHLKARPVRRHLGDLTVHPRDELLVAGLQEAVGLVQDEESALPQRHLARRYEVFQSSRRGDDDVDSCPQSCDLVLCFDAPDHQELLHDGLIEVLPKHLELVQGLLGQFPRRLDYDCLGRVRLKFSDGHVGSALLVRNNHALWRRGEALESLNRIVLERLVPKVERHFSVLQHDGGKNGLALVLPSYLEREPEVLPVLGVGDLLIVEIQVAAHDVGLAKRLPVIVKLAVIGLFSRATETVAVFARAQVQISLCRREPNPAKSLVFDHGLVVPLPPARRPLGRPAPVPLLLVAALTSQSVWRHGQVAAAVVDGHQPLPTAASGRANVATSGALPFLKSLLMVEIESELQALQAR